MNAIEIRAADFAYARRPVLEKLDLTVREGEIYGLVGPNGAGKTTTLRLLLGLERASAGTVEVLGERMPAGRRRVLAEVGALVDSPMAYPHLTGRENLDLLRRVRRLERAAIEDALALVGLAADGSRRVREYSLGMRQRLGVAAALLHRPRLLVLDEPSNALDPLAAVELRGALRRLADAGSTLLVSSHNLAELERIVDRIGILIRGRLDFEGSLAELAGDGTTWVRVACVPARALEILGRAGHLAEAAADGVRVRVGSESDAATVNRLLVTGGVDVSALAVERPNLEAVFLARVAAAEAKLA